MNQILHCDCLPEWARLTYLAHSGLPAVSCKKNSLKASNKSFIDQVCLVKTSSRWLDITSGILQGSILGPLFFGLFINVLPYVVCSASTIALYADDSKMFRVINFDDVQMLFQNDLDKLYSWSRRNLMDFNSKKCKIIRITKKQVPFTNRVHLSDNSSRGGQGILKI